MYVLEVQEKLETSHQKCATLHAVAAVTVHYGNVEQCQESVIIDE